MQPYEFEFEGKILVVRVVDKDHKSFGGFQNPKKVGEIIEAPDWEKSNNCGKGIHGWPWGLSREGKEAQDPTMIWQVCEVLDPENVVDLGGKCKWQKLKLIHLGDQSSAMNLTMAGRISYIFENSEGSAANSGNGGSAANSGNGGSAANSGNVGSAANSGDYGSAANSGIYGSAANSGIYGSAANSGDYGSAANSGIGGSAANSGIGGSAANSGKYGSAANSGNGGSAANSGTRGSAANSGIYGSVSSTGKNSLCSSSGLNSKAKTSHGGIVLGYIPEGSEDVDYKLAMVPRDLKPDVWYKLDENGNFVESE